MSLPVATDVAYAAGLFEGEGSIGIHRSGRGQGWNPSYCLFALINMCDREPLDALHDFWGGKLRDVPPKEADWRPITRWVIHATGAARFLADIRPHLQTQRIQTKVALALAFQAQKRRMGRGVTAAYTARQAEFAHASRQLNLVGSAAISADERQAIVDNLLGDQQRLLAI